MGNPQGSGVWVLRGMGKGWHFHTPLPLCHGPLYPCVPLGKYTSNHTLTIILSRKMYVIICLCILDTDAIATMSTCIMV